jgi:hypothetical protein
MHSLEQSFTEPRVPGGMQYMSVVTRLSTVQAVFMNRFLVEFLDYIAGVVCVCVCVCARARARVMGLALLVFALAQPHVLLRVPRAGGQGPSQPEQPLTHASAGAPAHGSPAALHPWYIALLQPCWPCRPSQRSCHTPCRTLQLTLSRRSPRHSSSGSSLGSPRSGSWCTSAPP